MVCQYHAKTAQVQMTLSAIAYAGDTGPPDQIKKAIHQQLQSDHSHNGKPYSYATEKNWNLVWGPVIAGDFDNLLYVAEETATGRLSLVLRGTIGEVMSFYEDLPIGQEQFPSAPSALCTVSDHFLDGLNALLVAKDQGMTLSDYLQSALAQKPDRTIYVTGHSQGGGLTPMLLGWLIETAKTWPGGDKFKCAGYGFAPPSSGNDAFAAWVASCYHATAPCFLVINPVDIVPMGYAQIGDIVSKGIPSEVPVELVPILDAASLWAKRTGPWAQPSTNQITLDAIELLSLSYLEQIGGQHNHNSYLYLLGAPQVYDVGTASPMELP